jgi:hypothetical protein
MYLNLSLELAAGIEGEAEVLDARKEYREVSSTFGKSNGLLAMFDSASVLTCLPVVGSQVVVHPRKARNVAGSLRNFARLAHALFQLIVPSKWPQCRAHFEPNVHLVDQVRLVVGEMVEGGQRILETLDGGGIY